MRYVKGKIDRNQISFDLLSFEELIDENNYVRVIDAFIDIIDINKLDCKYSKVKQTGRSPYNPKDMLKLYVYGYFNGIRTSRKLEKECNRNVELMWLINGLAPDFKTIADFRKDNKKAVIGIFKEFSLLCHELKLIGKEIVAIDGSKFRACNGRHKNFTKRKIEKMLEHYDQAAKKYIELLDHADDNDSDEKKINVNEIQDKLRKAKERIEELSSLQKEVNINGEVSITDPDAKHMNVSNQGTDIAHNIQVAVDSKHHIVVAVDVTSKAADNGQLYTMANQAKQELDVDKLTVLADKGYYNGRDLMSCEKNGIRAIISKQKFRNSSSDVNFTKDKFKYDKEKDVYICPMGKELVRKSGEKAKRQRYRCLEYDNCPYRENCTTNTKGREISPTEYQEYYDRADKLFSDNIELYKQRQMIVEHPFGTVKRALGYTYFLGRGNEKVRCESYMHFLIYNLKRVINILGINQLLEVLKKKISDKKQGSFI